MISKEKEIKEIINQTKMKKGIKDISAKSYKDENYPISPSVEKYDKINASTTLDNKLKLNYVPISYSEPVQISLIKDRVLRGSLA